MTYDPHNLVRHTVQARYRGSMRRANCEVGWAIDPYANGGRTWTWCHQWGTDGCCLHCHKTVKQILVPYKEKYVDFETDTSMSALQAAIESGN